MQLPSHTQTSLIIIQPTPFCNIDCSYCYLPQRANRARLTIDQLEAIFTKLVTFPTLPERVSVVWHAGEPLVLGPSYYEAAFGAIAAIAGDRVKIDHAMQTNGILISDEWCELFRRWDVGLGVSIDGPRSLNDLCRKTRDGRGTYDKTVSGIARLRANDIPFYVISVLTRAAIAQPEAMFEFYRQLDIRDVGFNIEEKEGVHQNSSLGGDFDEASIVRFFARFSELMVENQFPIAVRELEEALGSIRMLDEGSFVSHQCEPFGIVTVDVDGNVFTFSPELAGYTSDRFATFSIGNIFEATFEQMLESPVLQAMKTEIDQGIDRCRLECRYFRVCGGGTPSNKLFENGSFATTETMYCRLTKQRVIDFVLQSIEARLAT